MMYLGVTHKYTVLIQGHAERSTLDIAVRVLIVHRSVGQHATYHHCTCSGISYAK